MTPFWPLFNPREPLGSLPNDSRTVGETPQWFTITMSWVEHAKDLKPPSVSTQQSFKRMPNNNLSKMNATYRQKNPLTLSYQG